MKINTMGSYAGRMNSCINPMYDKRNSAVPAQTVKSVKKDISEVKKIFREMQRDEYGTANRIQNSSHIDSIQKYSDSLRSQRKQAKNTANSLKKLKYQFKNISSKILRSKTSAAARQVVGQARREIIRLNREKQNENVDSEELEAAIAHAKAMERVARKKVKHLEEEEMAKASGGPCSDSPIDEELREKNREAAETGSQNEYQDYYPDDKSSEWKDDNNSIDLSQFVDNLKIMLSDVDIVDEDMLGEVYESMEDMLSEMTSAMNEMIEDMGLDELSESLMAAKGDMDPSDIKMMIIKHRNKEMKEIVKADADYLKTVFDHLQNMKADGPQGISANSGVLQTISTEVSTVIPTPTGMITGITTETIAPVVDIAL